MRRLSYNYPCLDHEPTYSDPQCETCHPVVLTPWLCDYIWGRLNYLSYLRKVESGEKNPLDDWEAKVWERHPEMGEEERRAFGEMLDDEESMTLLHSISQGTSDVAHWSV